MGVGMGSRLFLASSALLAMASPALAQDVTCTTLSGLQVAAGFVTWLNVLRVVVVVGAVGCVGVLLATWFTWLLAAFAAIPLAVYEAIGYAASLGLVASGHWLRHRDQAWTSLAGSLLLGAVLLVSGNARRVVARPDRLCAILFLAWTAVAVAYGDEAVGFIAVLAFMGMLGFGAALIPMGYAIGFTGDDAVPRATVAALAVTTAAVAWRLSIAAPNPLVQGGLWVGPFVAGLGLLIASSRHYGSDSPWALRQVAPLVLGFVAVGVGNLYGIAPLAGIGGTFWVLFLVDKAADIPVQGRTQAAFLGLATCCVLGAGVWWAQDHIDLVRPYLLF